MDALAPPPIVVPSSGGVDLAATTNWIRAAGKTQTGRRAVTAILKILQFIKALAVIHHQRVDSDEAAVDVADGGDVTVDDRMIALFDRFATSWTRPEGVPATDPASRFSLFNKLRIAAVTLYNAYAEDIAASLQRKDLVALDGMLDRMRNPTTTNPLSNSVRVTPGKSETASVYPFFESRSIIRRVASASAPAPQPPVVPIRDVSKQLAEIERLKGIYNTSFRFAYLQPELLDQWPGGGADVVLTTMTADALRRLDASAVDAALAEKQKTFETYMKVDRQLDELYRAYPNPATGAAAPADWRNAFASVGDVYANVLAGVGADLQKLSDTARLCQDVNSIPCQNVQTKKAQYAAVTAAALPSSGPSTLATVVAAIQKAFPNATAAAGLTDPAEILKSVVSDYVLFKDDLIPFRSIVSFRTDFPNPDAADQPYTSQATANLTNLLNLSGPAAAYRALNATGRPNEETLFKSVTHGGQKYGPYYQVVNSGNAIDVKTDIRRLFEEAARTTPEAKKRHYIYSAYGFSGSGKTYDLLESSDSILLRILTSIAAENAARPADAKVKLEAVVYDLYGEICDEGCLNYNPARVLDYCDLDNPNRRLYEDLTFFTTDAANHQTISHKRTPIGAATMLEHLKQNGAALISDISLTTTAGGGAAAFIEHVRAVNAYRASRDFNPNPNGSQKLHIRATPNNPSSSRSHLFIDLYVKDAATAAVVGKCTVMDMAGSEDTNTIQQNYFKEATVRTIGKQNSIKTLIDKVTAAFNKELPSSKIRSITSKDVLTLNINRLIESSKMEVTMTNARLYLMGSIQPWMNLYYSYKKNGIVVDNFLLFILKNDFYTVRNYNSQYNANKAEIAAKFADLQTNFNALLAKFPPNSRLKLDAEQMFTAFVADKRREIEAINDSILTNIDNIRDIFNKANAGYLEIQSAPEKSGKVSYKLVNRINQTNVAGLIAGIQTEDVADVVGDINAAMSDAYNTELSKIDEFIKTMLLKIHCPLRYQGNYINYTLENMKAFAESLIKNEPASLKDVLTTTLLRHNIFDADPAAAFDLKFVLISKARLDFNQTPSENDARHLTYYNALNQSLEFSHCINPFSDKKSASSFKCKSLKTKEPCSSLAFAPDCSALNKNPADYLVRTADIPKTKQSRRGGALDALDAPDIVSDVLLAAGSLLIVFAAALGFGERALTATPEPSAKVRAATFLAFYTLFALLWAAMGLVGARTFILHLLIVYAIVGVAAEFAPETVKKKSSGVFAAAFIVAVVGLVVSAAAAAAPA